MKRLDLYRLGRGSQQERAVGVDAQVPRSDRGKSGQRGRDRRFRLLEELRERTGGEIVTGDGGALLLVEEHIPLDHRHGTVSLHEAFGAGSERVGTLFPLIRELGQGSVGFRDLLFFDIETTGLSGGAGTYLFLAGFLRTVDDGFHLRQFFMHSLSSERFFLEEIGRELRETPFLVSYNGKSYDYNILRNRYIMAGLPSLEQEPVHLDLLYTSRRLWRGLFPEYTLSTVEERALGLRRFDDIPGWQIPAVYADYLRGREVSGELTRIIFHNRGDVLSLLALLLKQLGLIDSALNAQPGTEEQYDPVALSDILITDMRREEARTVLSANRESNEVLKRLILMYKRDRQYDHALRHLEELHARQAGLADYLFSCTEAAKIYEHRVGDFETALRYTERMLRRLERAKQFGRIDAGLEQIRHEILHRMKRLQRKLGRLV